MKFKESELAKKYCTGSGLEIGGAAHNPFGLNTLNVDIVEYNEVYKAAEISLCGEALKVDIVASGDNILLEDNSQDFIVNSHVLEHFRDPIAALIEWYRLVKPGGIIFSIIPHKDRTFDADRDRTTLDELIIRHKDKTAHVEEKDEHHSVWITEDIVELIKHMNKSKMFGKKGVKIEEVQDVDDKVGNGFTIVLRKR